MKLYSQYLREKFHLPDDWQVCVLDVTRGNVPPGYAKVTGGVPVGKWRDGRPRWAALKKLDTHFVADADYDVWLNGWEQRTGVCTKCEGKGEAYAWSVTGGTRRRKCSRCGAEPEPEPGPGPGPGPGQEVK